MGSGSTPVLLKPKIGTVLGANGRTLKLVVLVVVVVGGSRAGHLRKFLEAQAFMHGATPGVSRPLCALNFAERFKEQEADPRTTNLRVLPLAPRTVPT